MRLVPLLVLAALVALVAPASADDAAGATIPDSTAVWDGMLHLRVACAAAVASCRGDLTIYDPADTVHSLDGGSYSVAGGKTATVTIDPSSARTNERLAALRSVVVRLDALGGAGSYERKLTLTGGSRTGPPTKRQVVQDRRGDARSSLCRPLDIVKATATRKGSRVVFQVTSASALTQHDGFGNRISPQMEFPWPGSPRRTPIQLGSDGSLRGYTMRYWPKVPHAVRGRTITWKVPLKYLAKGSFRWRAVCLDGYRVGDAAPNRGYRTFVR